jgi:hypothetical protein
MASGGVTSRNTRQGFRSEYIVKYIFSAFGTTVDVSVENDLGLDLLCNLTSFEDKLIVYKSSYGIQVKSKGKPFKYSSKQATKWLSKLEFPILLVEVDKAGSAIKVFSTWNINKYLLGFLNDNDEQYPEEILFITSNDDKLTAPDSQKGTIPVGKPILEFQYNDIDDPDKCAIFHKVLSEWLELDNENYKLRRAGVSRTFGFITWETNKPLSEVNRVWDIWYSYSPFHTENGKRLLSKAVVSLALFNRDSFKGNNQECFRQDYNLLKEFASKYLTEHLEEFGKEIFKENL